MSRIDIGLAQTNNKTKVKQGKKEKQGQEINK